MSTEQTALPLHEERLEERIASAILKARLGHQGDIRKFYESAFEKDPATQLPVDDKLQDLQSAVSGRERKLRSA